MRLPKFEYVEPKTVKGAAKTLALDEGRSVIIAGGSDILANMKHRLIEPERLVSLRSIPKLAYIRSGRAGLKIGTLTTLHDIAGSGIIRKRYPALNHAALEAGAYAHQVMGTVGGNLCQGNRCRYYNQTTFWREAKTPCYKAGGEMCYVVRKPAECYSAYSGDLAPVLIALHSQIRIAGPDGERSIPLTELYTQDGKEPLSLRNGDIIREVLVPPPSGKTAYIKWRTRGAIEWPLISVAVSIGKDAEGKVKMARIVFSAVGPGPVEAPEAEKMLVGQSLSDQLIQQVSAAVVKEISPLRTTIVSPAYKRRMASVLTQRALEKM